MRINPDSPILLALSHAFDAAVVTVLGILCALPVVTLGPALTAMYATMMAIAEDRCSGTLRYFFNSFKENFRLTAPLGLGYALAGAVLVGDWWVLFAFDHEPSMFISVLRGTTIAFTVLFLAYGPYLFGGMGRYEVTRKQALRNGLGWMAKKPAGALEILVCWVLLMAAVYLARIMGIFVAIACLYVQARVLCRTFDPEGWKNRHPSRSAGEEEIYYE